MSFTERHIVETYSKLLEGLSSSGKLELIDNLSKSLTSEKTIKDQSFYASFGGFSSGKPAGEIITAIKSSRNFRTKDLGF